MEAAKLAKIEPFLRATLSLPGYVSYRPRFTPPGKKA